MAALGSRLVWVIRVHPPGEALFSDMGGYFGRATALVATGELLGARTPPSTRRAPTGCWRCLALGGAKGAAVLWALRSAAAPVLGALLGARVGSRPWVGPTLGLLLLAWPPHLSQAGYFLSETPALSLQLLATLLLARLLQEGRGAWGAGLALALAFLVRPQVAVFGGLAGMLLLRRQPRALLGLALPGLLAAAWMVGLHHRATGTLALTGNGAVNQAVARCSLLRLETYGSEAGRAAAVAGRRGGWSWWLEPPSFREHAARLPSQHPLALRPALGPDPVRVVGAIDEIALSRRLAARCVAVTGLGEQLRSALVHSLLLWWSDRPWPEISWAAPGTRTAVRLSHRLAGGLVLPLALVGAAWILLRQRDRPASQLAGLQVLALLGVSAVFFGSLRLRGPTDPYLLLLALEGLIALKTRFSAPS